MEGSIKFEMTSKLIKVAIGITLNHFIYLFKEKFLYYDILICFCRIRVWLCDKGEGLDGSGALYELSLGKLFGSTNL